LVQITYAIKINPRLERTVRKGNELALQKMQEVWLRTTGQQVKNEMQRQAPVRTGRLRTGIKIVKKEKQGGGLDRRANISVESTVSYSRNVIAGARPSIGDGSPGTGKFFGPGGFGHPATKGWNGGKAFRSGAGFWPGFRPNDFVSRAEAIVIPKIIRETKFIGVNAYTESYNKLGINFGS
jgi:hypothetical protein